jgi:hypothetical protein
LKQKVIKKKAKLARSANPKNRVRKLRAIKGKAAAKRNVGNKKKKVQKMQSNSNQLMQDSMM